VVQLEEMTVGISLYTVKISLSLNLKRVEEDCKLLGVQVNTMFL
jgi:hypothetical protein